MPTKSPLQKILQGILHTGNESIQNHDRTGSTKPQEKKRQGTREKHCIDSAVHNQTLQQQKQVNDRNHHIHINILTLNVNGLNSPIKRHSLANWIKKGDPTICCLQETHLFKRNKHWLRVKD
jgi:hypothetical protein